MVIQESAGLDDEEKKQLIDLLWRLDERQWDFVRAVYKGLHAEPEEKKKEEKLTLFRGM